MNTKTIASLLTTVFFVLGLAFFPATAFAEDNASADDEPTVTMEDMTTSNESDTTSSDQVLAANGNPDTNWAVIVGRNALWGGIAGALVGTGLYLVTGMDWSPWVIAQFAGGGILVGATVGVISAATQADPDTTTALERPSSVDWVTRDAPRTYQLDVVNIDF